MKENHKNSEKRIYTPLGIIALFFTFTEIALVYAATQLEGSIQLLLIIFVVLFPLIVAGALFLILLFRPFVFYAPQEYG